MPSVKRTRRRSVRTAIAVGIAAALAMIGIGYAVLVQLPHDEELDPLETPSMDVSEQATPSSVDMDLEGIASDSVELSDSPDSPQPEGNEGDVPAASGENEAPASQGSGGVEANTDPNTIETDWRLNPPEGEFITQ